MTDANPKPPSATPPAAHAASAPRTPHVARTASTPRTASGEPEHTPSAPASPAAAEAVRDALLWSDLLSRQFPDLLGELAPSPGSRHSSAADRHPPGADELAARDARTTAERRDALLNEQRHGLSVPGQSAAPIRLHISDAIRDITDGVAELEEAVHDRLGLGRPRRLPVPGRLERIAALSGAITADETLAEHVRDEIRRMSRRCSRALGETEPMVRLPGRCPECGSVSLRAFPARRVVLCVNPGCRCADAGCDCRTDPAFRHLWGRAAWPELARVAGAGLSDIAASMAERAATPAGTSGGRA